LGAFGGVELSNCGREAVCGQSAADGDVLCAASGSACGRGCRPMSMSCEGEKQEPWSLEALRREADEFLQTCYGLELHIPILVNRRLKRVLGRFALKGGRPFAIELSADLLQYQERHVIVDVLKHECIHYACYMLGKPYRDGAPD